MKHPDQNRFDLILKILSGFSLSEVQIVENGVFEMTTRAYPTVICSELIKKLKQAPQAHVIEKTLDNHGLPTWKLKFS